MSRVCPVFYLRVQEIFFWLVVYVGEEPILVWRAKFLNPPLAYPGYNTTKLSQQEARKPNIILLSQLWGVPQFVRKCHKFVVFCVFKKSQRIVNKTTGFYTKQNIRIINFTAAATKLSQLLGTRSDSYLLSGWGCGETHRQSEAISGPFCRKFFIYIFLCEPSSY